MARGIQRAGIDLPFTMRSWALIALLVSAGACASAPKPAVVSSAALAETELIARVKTALLNDPVVGLRRIDVLASRDEVRLAGRVASAAERDRALEIARGVPGVRSVTSQLEIRP